MTMSTGRNLITTALSFWLVIGIFVDGWAHRNLPSLETFFTPWHAIFYSGFAAVAAWCGWNVVRGRKEGLAWKQAVPTGYLPALVGLAIFMVGGATDMVWHIIFGIETDIDALLSPTHLMLFLGAALIVTAPYRSFSARWVRAESPASFSEFSPTLLSMTLLMVLTSFMFMYLSAFDEAFMRETYGHSAQGQFGNATGLVEFLSHKSGIASILITNVILFAPALLLVRSFKTPFGSFTIAFTVVAALITSLQVFALWPFIVSSFLGGLATDVLAKTIRPSTGRSRLISFAAAASGIFWSLYVGAVALEGMGWAVEFWSGTIIWAALSTGALAVLMSPSERGIEAGEF